MTDEDDVRVLVEYGGLGYAFNSLGLEEVVTPLVDLYMIPCTFESRRPG